MLYTAPRLKQRGLVINLQYTLTGLALALADVLPAHAAVYDIGPGKPYLSLGAFPFEDLQAGDTVNIH